MTEKLRRQCSDARTLDDPDPFLLPTGALGGSTTQYCTHIRHGHVYQLLLEYEDEASLRGRLETYNWAQQRNGQLNGRDSMEYA